MALDVAEVGVVELAEVYRMVDPLLDDVGLQQPRHEYRRAVNRAEPRQRGEQERERPGVLDGPVHVPAVPWPGMMLQVEVVEAAVQEVPHRSRAIREAAVQDVAMDE